MVNLLDMQGFLDCSIERGDFNYLGMKIGINPYMKGSWSWLVQKIKDWISKWDEKNISMGGRATLVQSVLSSIPIYSLSFYLLPNNAIFLSHSGATGILMGRHLLILKNTLGALVGNM